jgi:RHS repeat-associated protein
VTVPAGATSVSFNVTTSPVASDTLATITASFSQSVATGAITVLAPQLVSVSLVPSAVTSGSAATGTVTLTGPAPTAFVVNLSSNNAAATVPASVTIAANASSATFTATTSASTINATATISATWAGITQQAALSVSQAQMSGLTINPLAVQNGSSATGTVTLSPSGLTSTAVGLSSNVPDAVVPATVTVAAGAPSASFPITTALQSANSVQATITATLGSATQQATVRVNPPMIAGVTLSPTTIEGGARTIITPFLTGPAPLSGMPVYLWRDSSCNLVENTVPIPGGTFPGVLVPAQGSSAQASMLTGPVASTSTIIVTASPSYQDFRTGSQSAPLTVSPAAVTISSLTLSPATVVGSNDTTGTVTLTANAPAAGLDVDLGGSDGTITTAPKFVHVAAGHNTATFTVGTTDFAATSVTISATYSATVKTATLTVNGPPAIYPASVTVVPTLTGGTGATATLHLNAPATVGSGTVVALSSSNPALTLPSSVSVKKNTSSQTFTVNTTTVTTAVAAIITASYGGVITRTRVIVLPANGVAVTAVSVSPASGTASVTSFQGTVTLTSAAHTGGAVVTLGGSRTGMVTVPASVTVAAGQTTASFAIQTFSYGVPKYPYGGTDVTASYGGVTVTTPLALVPVLQCDTSPVVHPIALCASLSLAPCLAPATSLDRTLVANVVSSDPSRYYLYTPELQLLAETEQSTGASKAITSSYLWFGGMPVASVDSSGMTRWYATDHLGTPILQTDAAGTVAWRAEYTPYGDVFTIRSGAALHQPLRLPGQVAQDGSNLYNNVFRSYRSGWGRYTQADPIGLRGGSNLYSYATGTPTKFSDRLGLVSWDCRVGVVLKEGEVLGIAAITVSCTAECREGHSRLVQLLGLGTGVTLGLPISIAFHDIKVTEPSEVPAAANLAGYFSVHSLEASIIAGYVFQVEVVIGKAKGSNSGWDAKGIAIGFDSLAASTYVISDTKTCCNE